MKEVIEAYHEITTSHELREYERLRFEALSNEKSALEAVKLKKDEEWKAVVEVKDAVIKAKDAEIEAKDAEIEAKDAEIEAKDAEIEAKDAEIARLRSLLKQPST